ncbi:MAG: hypothetical protein ACP5QO_04835 [Clostridia bacterium]
MEPNWDKLLRAVQNVGCNLGLQAVLVAGSWARGQADDASDVDILAITRIGPRSVLAGLHDDQFIEVLYAPLDDLDPWARPPARATFQGARVLFNPEGVGLAWVSRFETYLAGTRPPGAALLSYQVWNLRHALHALETLSRAGDPASLLYVRNRFAEELVAYLYTKAGVWIPGVRRQIDGLVRIFPESVPLVTALLLAGRSEGVAHAAQCAYARLVGEWRLSQLARAPLLPLP